MTTQHAWLPYPVEIVEISQNGFAMLDSAGRILYLNRCAAEALGIDVEQAAGSDFADSALRESDRERFRGVLASLIVDSSLESRQARLDVAIAGKRPERMSAELSVGAVQRDGEWVFHVWMHDLSARTEALRELADHVRAAGPGLTEILDALAEAVTIRDPDHHLVYANRAALDHMGFASLEEIQRRPLPSIFADYMVQDEHGRDVTMDDIPSVKLLAGQDAPPLLIRTVHRRTGDVGWQVLKASLLHGADGALMGTVMIIEDVTSEKLAELRERFLTRATGTLMSSIDYEETLRNVAWLAVPEIADWCAVDLFDEAGGRQQVVVAHPDPAKLALAEEMRQYEREIQDDNAVRRVANSGVPELYSVISDEMLAAGARSPEHLELLRVVGLRSALLVPMLARGRTLGVMTLVSAESLRRFDEGDLEFAGQVASRAAIAVDNARLATARRDIAITLQRSLLPDAVPQIAGWKVAAMYRPASAGGEVEVGGDLYDFIETPAGWFVLLGDVTGRGVQAAALTSLVRHGARFLAREEQRPSAILAGLDEALRERPTLALCTALCLRLEESGVVYSSAGHPAPLIVGADGGVRELAGTGPLLGGWAQSAWEDQRVEVGSGEMLVLYTDGVTDTRGEEARFGSERLEQLLRANAGKEPAEMLANLELALDEFRVTGWSDDTAAVALCRSSSDAGEPSIDPS